MKFSRSPGNIGMIAACFFAATVSTRSADSPFQVFDDVCLSTAGALDRVSSRMKQNGAWLSAPSSNDDMMQQLEGRRAWYLDGDMEAGVVISGKIPLEAVDSSRMCMLAMPSDVYTLNDASQFLVEAGGQLAYPQGKHNSENPFFAFLMQGDWVMVGVLELPSATHLQFLLLDVPDEDVRSAIDAAKRDHSKL